MSKLIVSIPHQSVTSAASLGTVSTSEGTLYDFVLAKDEQTTRANNRAGGKAGSATLSELPKADATVLVVPVRALSWHQVDLPKVPKARLRAALNGLLEERLLDDTHDLAFALSPDVPVGKAATGAWVAACNKAWLSSAIKKFEAAGCRVTQVVPQFWPLGASDVPSVAVTGSPEEAWITRADAQGVMTIPLKTGDTSGLLQSLLANLPADTQVGAAPAVTGLAENCLAAYPDLKVELRENATGLLQSATSLWELAQFEQSLSGDSEGMKNAIRQWQTFWQSPVWRPVRWGLAAVLCANIVGLNAWAWQQQTSLKNKRAQLGTILTQTFPNVKAVVDPSLQMSREIVVLRQETGASSVQNFESMLSAISTSNNNVAGVFIAPTAIEYVANGLNLKNFSIAAADLPAAQAKLKTMGYTLTQNGTTASLKVQAAP